MNMYGLLYFLSTTVCIKSTFTNYPRWSASLTSGTDGIIFVDAYLKKAQVLHQSNDILLRTTCDSTNIACRSSGLLLSGAISNNGNYSLAGKYTVPGMQGGIVSYPIQRGSPVISAGQRPFWFDTAILPRSCSHVFGAGIGDYITNLDNALDAFNANTYDGLTAAANTSSTTVYAPGAELNSAAEGDYLYNSTRSAVACILGKPTASSATTRSIAGQASGDTIVLATRHQFNHYFHDVVRVATFKASDNLSLGDVAIGIFQAADGAGQIVTDISTDSTMVTLAANTDTTNLYCSGTEFDTVSVGDRIFNQTRALTRIVLTKPSSTQLTCDAITGMTTSDEVCFSSSTPYPPVLSRFVVMDGDGEYVSSFDPTKGVCVTYAKTSNGAVRFETIVDYTSALTMVALRYGYYSQSMPVEFIPNGAEKLMNVSMVDNPYIVADESTARAYTGIAISGTDGAMIITLSESHTAQEIYDYTEVWRYDQAVDNDDYYAPVITPVSSGVFNMGTTRIVVASGGTLTVDTDTDVGALMFGTRPVSASNAILVESGGTLTVGQAGSQGRSLDFTSLTLAPSPFYVDADIAIAEGATWDWVATEIQSHRGIRIKGTINISAGNAKLLNEGDVVNPGGIPPRFTIDEANEYTSIENLETVYFGVTILKTCDLLSNVSLESSKAGLIVGGAAPASTWINASGISFISNVLDFGFSGERWMRLSDLESGSDLMAVGAYINDAVNNKGLLEIRQSITFTATTDAKIYTIDTDNGLRLAASQIGTNPDYVADREYELTSVAGEATYDTDGGVLTSVYWRTVGGLREDSNMHDSRGINNNTSDVFTWIKTEYGQQVGTQNIVMKGSSAVEATIQSLPDLGITDATKSNVASYTGITPVYATGTLTVTVTEDHTWNEIYDYIKYWENENPDAVWSNSKASFVSTSNKLSYTYDNLAITIDGCSVTCGAVQSLPDEPTVVSAGFFKDTNGAKWEDSGSIYYASNITYTVLDGATPIQYAEIAHLDSSNVNRTYNTSHVAVTSLTSDVNGVAEGYAVWKIDSTSYASQSLVTTRYGYNRYSAPKTLSGSIINENILLANDTYIVADEATVAAYTGIALDYGVKTVTISADHTIQETYDYIRYSNCLQANIAQPTTISSTNGTDFILLINWSIIVTGAGIELIERDKSFTVSGTGSITVVSGGFYESRLGARWDVAGETYFGSHIKHTILDGITPKQYVEVAYYDTIGGDNRTYNTSHVAVTSLTSDVNGLAEGYAVWQIDSTPYASQNLKARLYGYATISIAKTLTGIPITENNLLTTDLFVVDSRSNVAAYTGITMDYSGKNVTITEDHTLQQMYDYIRYSDSLQANLEEPDSVSTINGIDYTLYTNCNTVVSGSGVELKQETKSISYQGVGALIVSSGGLYEDKNKVEWNNASSTYYASHWYGQVKDADTSLDIEDTTIGFGDITTQTRLLYNTSTLAITTLVTDSSGKADGYFAYQIDSNVYSNTKTVFADYNHIYSLVPRTLSGLPIGSSSTPEVTRLNVDNEVTQTKANAISNVSSAIIVTRAIPSIDMGNNNLMNIYDNLKARQSSDSDIEPGVPGCVSVCLDGLLIAKSGDAYTGKSGWTYENVYGGSTFQTGTIQVDTASTFSPTLVFGIITIEFTEAGDYDYRLLNFSDTVTVTNTSGGVVNLKMPLTATVINTGPDINLEQSIAGFITAPNLIDDTRVQIYDITDDAELDNSVVSGGSGYSLPVTIGVDVQLGSTVRLRAVYVDGLAAKENIQSYGVITTTGVTFIDSQVDDAVYIGNAIDGSTVTEFTADYPNVQIDLDDPDGVTTVQRLYAWYRYNETSEDGIRNFFNGIFAEDYVNYRVVTATVNLLLDNVGDNILVEGGHMYRDDGAIIVFANTTGSVIMDPGKAYLANADVQEIADAVLATEVDDGITLRTSEAAILSTVAGVASGGNTANIAFRNANNSSDRVTMVVDTNGNRSSVSIIPD